ncbi:MAG: tetratricopeptide repeat protein [Acidobacteriota bacterium]
MMAKPRVQSRARSLSALNPPHFWIVAGLMALSFCLYVNTLHHGFVFDDATLISQNPEVTRLQWGKILSGGVYRPLRTLSYAVNYFLGGLDPFGYHLFNVALHSLNVLLVYLLFFRLTESGIAAGAGALLFAVHPVQTAAVAYVSGRKDLMAAFFVLLSTLCYLSYRRKKRFPLLLAAIVSFWLGVLSKEVAIILPALLVLVDLLLASKTGEGASFVAALAKSMKKSPLIYVTLTALAGLALYYAIFLTQASRKVGLWGGTLATHSGTCFKLFAHYLRLAFSPYPLLADYTGEVFPISTGLLEISTLLAVCLFASYLLVGLKLYRRQALISFAMMWFLIALTPVLQIVPFHEIAADHLLYLPLLGMALVAGAGVDYLVRMRGVEVLTWATFGLLVLGASFMTLGRNRDWKDDRTLWEATYRKAPGSYRANLNLGSFLYQQGDWRKAVRLTRRAAELGPDQALPWNNLGAMYRERGHEKFRLGQLDQSEKLEGDAIRSFEKAFVLEARDPFAYSNLGDAFKDLGLIWDARGKRDEATRFRGKAIENYRKALQIGSRHDLFPLVWFKLGMVFVDHGLYGQALSYLKRALDRLPGFDRERTNAAQFNGRIRYWVAFCYFQEKDYSQSAHYFELTLQSQPTIEVFGYLADSYERSGETGKAIGAYLRALQVIPNSVKANYNLGILYQRRGETRASVRYFERALQLDPSGDLASDIRQRLGRLSGLLFPSSDGHVQGS